jgi:hypothetical protein
MYASLGRGSVAESRCIATASSTSAGWLGCGGRRDLAGGPAPAQARSGRGAGASVSRLRPDVVGRWPRGVRLVGVGQRGRPVLRALRRRRRGVSCCPLCAARIDRWSKTVRDGEGKTFPVCDACWEADRSGLVIVPGPIVVWGKCLSCGEWKNPRDLVDVKPGAAGKGVAPGGTCRMCMV